MNHEKTKTTVQRMQPTRKDIENVFFKNVDLSRFINANFDGVIKNIQDIVLIWEKNK